MNDDNEGTEKICQASFQGDLNKIISCDHKYPSPQFKI